MIKSALHSDMQLTEDRQTSLSVSPASLADDNAVVAGTPQSLTPLQWKSSEDITMGNPHVLVDNTELAYLAGIFDGEGCISINKAQWKRVKAFCPKVRLANSNLDLINWADQTFQKLGIKCHICYSKRCEDNPKWKRVYDVSILNQTKCHKILKFVQPYLIAKRKQADLVIEWIESRWLRRGEKAARSVPYSKRELQIVAELGRLNQRGTSQTVDHELAAMISEAA